MVQLGRYFAIKLDLCKQFDKIIISSDRNSMLLGNFSYPSRDKAFSLGNNPRSIVTVLPVPDSNCLLAPANRAITAFLFSFLCHALPALKSCRKHAVR